MTSMASVQIFFLGFGFDACGQCTFDIAIFFVYACVLVVFAIPFHRKKDEGKKR